MDGEITRIIPPVIATAMRRTLLRWFEKNGRVFPWRRKEASTYQKVIAEFLLQRTRAETVSAFFKGFISHFPTWKSLSDATVEDIGAFLKPIGLWQRRSESLAALAKAMILRGGQFPATRDEIEALPGVGQYIANAILLFSVGQAEPLLDINMARVLERVFGPRKLVDIRYDSYLQTISRQVVRGKKAAEVNWAILDLAAKLCTLKNPKCVKCPLKKHCRFAREFLDRIC